MRFLIVADVHGNLEAFRKVVADANHTGGFQQIWHLGDIVGYGPDPGACIDLLREYDYISVAGNHDLGAIGCRPLTEFNLYAGAALQWTMGQLPEEHLEFLRWLPGRLEAHGFTMVHGSPRDPVWEYLSTAEKAQANFQEESFGRCLVGHTHVPRVCRYRGASAGCPAEIGG